MYWLFDDPESTDATSPTAGKLGYGAVDFIVSLETAYAAAFDPGKIENFFKNLQDKAVSLNTQVANGLQSNLKDIESTIFNVYKEGLDYGFAIGDASEFISEVNTGLARMSTYTDENVKTSLLLAKSMGMTAKEVGTMVKDIMVMGYGATKANEILKETFNQARKFGVDASVLTKTVSQNIANAAIYGFKDGVKGLTDMAIQAQRIGVEMKIAQGAADKFMDPEKAISAAASFQMLGGAVGGLADPFQLMYMAQSDMGGLQDAILKTASSAVEFNKKTGEMRIPPEMRRQLTEQAEILGTTYDALAKDALKARREQEIMSQLKMSSVFGQLKEEDKSLIASLGEIKDGEVQVKIPGTDNFVKAADLTTNQLTALKDYQAASGKSLEETATDQLSVLKRMAKTLEKMEVSGALGVGVGKGMELVETLNDMTMQGNAKVSELISKTQTAIGGLSTEIVTAYQGLISVFNQRTQLLITGINTAVEDLKLILNSLDLSTGADVFLPAGGNKTISTGFGEMIKLDKRDSVLAAPEDDLNLLMGYANLGEKTTKVIPNSINTTEKNETISKVIEQKITNETTTKNEVQIGGETKITIDINSNLPSDAINKLVETSELKEKIMTTINERLNKSFGEKLINATA